MNYRKRCLTQLKGTPPSYDKEVLGYFKGTPDHSLIFSKEDKIHIQGYYDADWASSSDKYVFQMAENGECISCKSKKTNIVALPSCKA